MPAASDDICVVEANEFLWRRFGECTESNNVALVGPSGLPVIYCGRTAHDIQSITKCAFPLNRMVRARATSATVPSTACTMYPVLSDDQYHR